MKSRIALVSAFALSFALAACGGVEDESFDLSTDQDVHSVVGGSNCTRPPYWWKRYNSAATDPALQIAWPIDEAKMFCGQTILWWVQNRPVKGDVWHQVAGQTIVAMLNNVSGAVLPPDVASALLTAQGIVQSSCVVAAADAPAAWTLIATLDQFNRGLTAPGACP